jgi:hypothetical protein
MDTKDMTKVYYDLYTDCMKFKKQKETQSSNSKSINCDDYRVKYEKLVKKDIHKNSN